MAAASAGELVLTWLNGPAGSAPLSPAWQGSAELTIGRDEECDIQLPNKDVSRRHATLRRNREGSGFTITDLSSHNGTRVNGRTVQSAPLRVNDVVRVGGCVFVVSEAPGTFAEVAPGLFGGAALTRALSALRKAALSELPIVLEGETGTGKELVARAIHTWSARRKVRGAELCSASARFG